MGAPLYYLFNNYCVLLLLSFLKGFAIPPGDYLECGSELKIKVELSRSLTKRPACNAISEICNSILKKHVEVTLFKCSLFFMFVYIFILHFPLYCCFATIHFVIPHVENYFNLSYIFLYYFHCFHCFLNLVYTSK